MHLKMLSKMAAILSRGTWVKHLSADNLADWEVIINSLAPGNLNEILDM